MSVISKSPALSFEPDPSRVGIMAQEIQPNITFNVNKPTSQEMLKIGPDGFYVRGKKIPVDENEGIAVFNALKRFLVEAELRRP